MMYSPRTPRLPPLAQALRDLIPRHWRLRKLCVALITITAFAWTLGSRATPTKDDVADILHVVDGDTVAVTIEGKADRVRLIGIDTPESKPNKRATIQSRRTHQDSITILELGARASSHTQQLLPVGMRVRLEYDVEKRDRYGRLLAYIWLPNGTMANEEIIRAGYAYVLTIPPNVKYRERFARAFEESQKERRGLWSSNR